jgi:hypothetical protein
MKAFLAALFRHDLVAGGLLLGHLGGVAGVFSAVRFSDH